jgi:hypothetical protein
LHNQTHDLTNRRLATGIPDHYRQLTDVKTPYGRMHKDAVAALATHVTKVPPAVEARLSEESGE